MLAHLGLGTLSVYLPPVASSFLSPDCLQEEEAAAGRGNLRLRPELLDEYNRLKQVRRVQGIASLLSRVPDTTGSYVAECRMRLLAARQRCCQGGSKLAARLPHWRAGSVSSLHPACAPSTPAGGGQQDCQAGAGARGAADAAGRRQGLLAVDPGEEEEPASFAGDDGALLLCSRLSAGHSQLQSQPACIFILPFVPHLPCRRTCGPWRSTSLSWSVRRRRRRCAPS